jgi:hypothetical protein
VGVVVGVAVNIAVGAAAAKALFCEVSSGCCVADSHAIAISAASAINIGNKATLRKIEMFGMRNPCIGMPLTRTIHLYTDCALPATISSAPS